MSKSWLDKEKLSEIGCLLCIISDFNPNTRKIMKKKFIKSLHNETYYRIERYFEYENYKQLQALKRVLCNCIESKEGYRYKI